MYSSLFTEGKNIVKSGTLLRQHATFLVFFIGKCVFLANVQTEGIAIFISSRICYQIRWRETILFA